MDSLRSAISSAPFFWAWGLFVLISFLYLIYDLITRNPQIMPLMKWVWGLAVLYSGPIGLAAYFYSGRRQIAHDSVPRRGFRSVAHCYSGCGAGEIIGVTIAAGAFSLNNWGISLITFFLAYVIGFGMTMGPLIQGGEDFQTALKDAFYSETPSIAIMEIVAIGVDLWLAGSARFNDPLFWSSLIVSLVISLIAAYPINILLIHHGVKEGMMNPKEVS